MALLLQLLRKLRADHTLSLHLSTTSSRALAPPETHFMVQYLMSSVGLSPEEALKASRTLPTNLQSTKNPDSVIRFLKETGLTPAHIKTLIAWYPRLLCANVQKTLAPRARELESDVFAGQMLVQLLRSNPFALILKGILPRLRFWHAFLGADECNLLRALKRNRTLINYDIDRKIIPNITLLRSYGLSDQHIATVRKSLCLNGRLKEALFEMAVLGTEVKFSSYDSLITRCVNQRALREGQRVHAHMIKTRYLPPVYLWTRLVIMYVRCDSLEDARNLLDGMPERNIVSWTAMISGYSQRGRHTDALELFVRMLRTGIVPCYANSCTLLAYINIEFF